MDYLAFYKKNESLKEAVSQFRFTYSRPYTQYFIRDIEHMEHLVSGIDDEVLLFYLAEKMSEEDNVNIQNIVSAHRHVKIVLLSDQSLALKAWRMKIFHFDAYPVVSEKLGFAYQKWERSKEGIHEELAIKTDEGIIKIRHSDILYLQAAGNYTMIHQAGDKCLVLTRQLGTFSDLTDGYNYFQRVHRSLVINFHNVKACKNNAVIFYKSQKPLEVSQLLETKVKKILMGNE